VVASPGPHMPSSFASKHTRAPAKDTADV
jgi:hypothetical protein